jgi:hypothetical protein
MTAATGLSVDMLTAKKGGPEEECPDTKSQFTMLKPSWRSREGPRDLGVATCQNGDAVD